MKYKLVISDFDGTLLRSDDIISDETKSAIKEFTRLGGIFGISTGRSFDSISKRLSELGLSGRFPVMSCQGALSHDSESSELLSDIPMDREAAVEFLRRAEDMGLTCQYYSSRGVYVPELNEKNRYYFARTRLTPVAVGKVSDCAAVTEDKIYKTLCFIEPRDRARVLAKMEGIEGTKVFASHAMLVEAVSIRAGKGNGLIATCKAYGVPPEMSVAIGDELNDIEMIKAAGLGVAMYNAVDEAKKAADFVTDTNDNDGVAKVLRKIIEGTI